MAKHGGKRKDSGRKTKAENEMRKMAARAVELTGDTPAKFLDMVMNDSTNAMAIRTDAAKCLMSYVHCKQPEAKQLDVSGLPDSIVFVFE